MSAGAAGGAQLDCQFFGLTLSTFGGRHCQLFEGDAVNFLGVTLRGAGTSPPLSASDCGRGSGCSCDAAWSSGFRVQGSGFRVQGSGVRV